MKNDLTCGVVGDLLPAFVEGLTSEESNAAVEAHLAACPACARLRETMAAPEGKPAEQAKEVDYLKAVKRKNARRVAAAVLCTIFVFIAGIGAKIFFVGQEANLAEMYLFPRIDAESQVFHLNVDATSSGISYWGWETAEEDGVVTATVRQGPVSFLHDAGYGRLEIPLEGVREIYFCGQLLYQDGMLIQSETILLFQSRTPYVGNAPALGHIAEILGIGVLHDYTTSLQTAQRPYGWTIEFTGDATGFGTHLDREMTWHAPLMLALVENLDQVSWTYTDGGVFETHTITLEEANAMLPQLTETYNRRNGTDWTPKASVKDYAASVGALQQLCDLSQLLYDDWNF